MITCIYMLNIIQVCCDYILKAKNDNDKVSLVGKVGTLTEGSSIGYVSGHV